jgi:mRNA interferase MazF
MPSTIRYSPGDIVLVAFPFSDLSATKQRPALVLRYDQSRADLLVVAITSQIPLTLAADKYTIPANVLAACGLPKPSIVRLGKIVSLHEQLVVRKIGGLPGTHLPNVLRQFRNLF